MDSDQICVYSFSFPTCMWFIPIMVKFLVSGPSPPRSCRASQIVLNLSITQLSSYCWPCVIVLVSSLVTGLVNCFTVRGCFWGRGGGTNNVGARPIWLPRCLCILYKPINIHHWEGSSFHDPTSFFHGVILSTLEV
jgi:hypothetical protein